MPSSLHAFSELLAADGTAVAVSDLDGVLRVFDAELWAGLDALTRLPAGTVRAAILGNPVLADVVRGRRSHAQWRERSAADLESLGVSGPTARSVVQGWADTPARIDEQVLEALTAARSRGIATFVFTNGTDRVAQEITDLGLPAWTRENLLNSAELGAAKPDPDAFARAHGRIEQDLGHPLPPGAVAFLDDSLAHVTAARRFGWRAVHHTRDSGHRL